MEIISFNSKSDDIAEAVRGVWGKEVYRTCKLVYCGQIIIGIGNKEELNKYCKSKHYEWEQLAYNVWLAVVV